MVPSSARQCATLPRRMPPIGPSGKILAPAPPRRDPKTTLSVGRARAKSMVAGLEGNGCNKDDDDDDDLPSSTTTTTTKSNSIESIHQQSHSALSTPTQAGPGTPTQPRTASIKARPTSSRITAAELEELFQRQQGENDDDGSSRYSTMMTSSRFQSGMDSATPPTSPQKLGQPTVYSSVAEMKRKKAKNGTVRGKPCSIPIVAGDLKRNFHSTPDLATDTTSSSSSSSSWLLGFKGHRSQDDVHALHASMQRLNLPPPNHPPPPPPIGQVVKVEVARKSEYESTVALQAKIHHNKTVLESDVMSSFKPASNAKLYASPQDIKKVNYRTRIEQQQQNSQNQVCFLNLFFFVCKNVKKKSIKFPGT